LKEALGILIGYSVCRREDI